MGRSMSSPHRLDGAHPDLRRVPRRRMPRGEAARRRAMEAAIAAVAELGGARVRMVDIAARAGMSTGHILYFFGRKDALLLEAVRGSEQDLVERLRVALLSLRSPRRKLARFVEYYLPTGASDPRWILWTQVFANPPDDEPSRHMLDSFDRAWEAELGEIVRDGVVQGKFVPVDVEQFVVRSRLLMDGLSVDVLMGSLRLTRERATAFALTAMDRDLRPEPRQLARPRGRSPGAVPQALTQERVGSERMFIRQCPDRSTSSRCPHGSSLRSWLAPPANARERVLGRPCELLGSALEVDERLR